MTRKKNIPELGSECGMEEVVAIVKSKANKVKIEGKIHAIAGREVFPEHHGAKLWLIPE